jgi:DNA-binding transcriptional LysR family regulator
MMHTGLPETRHLATLLLVAEEGSFVAAADLLGLSQAAVSQQMAALERTVGATLFDRPGGPRPVTLTPAGRVLRDRATRVLAELHAARQDLEDVASGTRGRLVIGTFQSVSVQLLPDIVARIRHDSPDLRIELVERDENVELIDLLVSGDLDVAFLSGTVHDDRLDVIELGTDPFLVLLPLDHQFALPKKPTAFPTEFLIDAPMIGQHPLALQQEIDDRLRPAGVQPRYVFRSNDNGAVQAMVRAGMGPAVMPRLAIDLADQNVIALPLDPPLEPRTIVVAQRAGAHALPAGDSFIQLAIRMSRDRLMPRTT